jgi:hypothetical protein
MMHKTKDGVLALRLKSFSGNEFFSETLQPVLYQADGGCKRSSYLECN